MELQGTSSGLAVFGKRVVVGVILVAVALFALKLAVGAVIGMLTMIATVLALVVAVVAAVWLIRHL